MVLVLVISIDAMTDTFQTHAYTVSGMATKLFKNSQSLQSSD